MNCPKCNRPVEDYQSTCPHCGEPIQRALYVDNDFVFTQDNTPWKKKSKSGVVVLIAIIVLILGLGAVSFWFVLQQKNNVETKPAGTTQTTTVADTTAVPAAEITTDAPTQAETKAPETTAPATTAPQSDEDKLAAYARSADLTDALKQAADDNMSVTISVEENALRARYRVVLDSQDAEQTEYFEGLGGYFNNLCASLDRSVYEMRENTGVNNAVLEIFVTDSNDVQLYYNLVD